MALWEGWSQMQCNHYFYWRWRYHTRTNQGPLSSTGSAAIHAIGFKTENTWKQYWTFGWGSSKNFKWSYYFLQTFNLYMTSKVRPLRSHRSFLNCWALPSHRRYLNRWALLSHRRSLNRWPLPGLRHYLNRWPLPGHRRYLNRLAPQSH